MEVRNKDTRTVGGLAIPFNVSTELYRGFNEVFRPGSVTLHERGVFMFWNHDPDKLLASTVTGRLRLDVRSDGVYYEADLPATTLGDDLLELISLGEVGGMSPGFVIDEQNFLYSDTGDTRQIVKCRVAEVSATYAPAYPTTSVELRNQDQGGDLHEELKQIAERKRYLAQLRSKDLARITNKTFSFKGN